MSRGSVLVTGVSGAVGRALLPLVREAGWDVVGIYHRNAAWADAVQRAAGPASATLQLLACDLTAEAQVARLLDRLGPDYCPDVLVHLAAPPVQLTQLHRTSWNQYQAQIDGVLKPVVLLTQPLLGRMLRRGQGRIVAALSAVVLGLPPRGFTAYTAAKYALAGYMRSLAAEYAARGIVANTVSPGLMDTDLLRELPDLLRQELRSSLPGGRWIDPDAVARAIFWLAAEAGPEVSGCNLPIAAGAAF